MSALGTLWKMVSLKIDHKLGKKFCLTYPRPKFSLMNKLEVASSQTLKYQILNFETFFCNNCFASKNGHLCPSRHKLILAEIMGVIKRFFKRSQFLYCLITGWAIDWPINSLSALRDPVIWIVAGKKAFKPLMYSMCYHKISRGHLDRVLLFHCLSFSSYYSCTKNMMWWWFPQAVKDTPHTKKTYSIWIFQWKRSFFPKGRWVSKFWQLTK